MLKDLQTRFPNADIVAENHAHRRILRAVVVANRRGGPLPVVSRSPVPSGLRGVGSGHGANVRRHPEPHHRRRADFHAPSGRGFRRMTSTIRTPHESARIRELSEKYGYEVVDIRPSWQKYLALHHMDRKELLSDVVHLKPNGVALMASMVVPHLRYDPEQQPAGPDRVRYYDAEGRMLKGSFDDATGVALTRPLRFEFEGNRVDVAAAADGKFGTARILVDGKKPSTFRGMYAATRTNPAPGSWFPAIRCVSWAKASCRRTGN